MLLQGIWKTCLFDPLKSKYKLNEQYIEEKEESDPVGEAFLVIVDGAMFFYLLNSV